MGGDGWGGRGEGQGGGRETRAHQEVHREEHRPTLHSSCAGEPGVPRSPLHERLHELRVEVLDFRRQRRADRAFPLGRLIRCVDVRHPCQGKHPVRHARACRAPRALAPARVVDTAVGQEELAPLPLGAAEVPTRPRDFPWEVCDFPLAGKAATSER